MSGTYRAPEVPSEQITGEFVRDELLRCFESANREFLTILRQPVAVKIRDHLRKFLYPFPKPFSAFSKILKHVLLRHFSAHVYRDPV